MESTKCNCPNCGQEIQVDEGLIGVDIACPICSELIHVQEESQNDIEVQPEQKLKIAKPVGLPGKLSMPPSRNSKTEFENVSISTPPSVKEKGNCDSTRINRNDSETVSKKSSNLTQNFHLAVSALILLVMGAFLVIFILKMQDVASIANEQNELLTAQGKELTAQGKELAAQSKQLTAIEKMQGTHSLYFNSMILPSYEYKVVEWIGTSYSKSDSNKFSNSEIQKLLNQYKDWELVDVIEVTETVHPNFGNSEYVTGLQPNVRTQKLQLILRKRK